MPEGWISREHRKCWFDYFHIGGLQSLTRGDQALLLAHAIAADVLLKEQADRILVLEKALLKIRGIAQPYEGLPDFVYVRQLAEIKLVADLAIHGKLALEGAGGEEGAKS